MMTLRERVIVETYTGICMTSNEERNEVYKYIQELIGRPVYTHELADPGMKNQLKEKSKDDFVKLCKPPQTNSDRIRSMTDEELAEFITKQFCHGIGKEMILEWLQSPVEV